jgi:hypothetical protein
MVAAILDLCLFVTVIKNRNLDEETYKLLMSQILIELKSCCEVIIRGWGGSLLKSVGKLILQNFG